MDALLRAAQHDDLLNLQADSHLLSSFSSVALAVSEATPAGTRAVSTHPRLPPAGLRGPRDGCRGVRWSTGGGTGATSDGSRL